MDVTIQGVAYSAWMPNDDELSSSSLETAAFDGEVGFGQLYVSDPASTLTPVTGRSAHVRENFVTIVNSFMIDHDRVRGAVPTGTGGNTTRVYQLSIQDPNCILTGFRVRRTRPKEFDYDRVLAFAALDLAPLAVTSGLTIDTTWVLKTNGVSLPKKKYEADGGWPTELIPDLVGYTGKTLFVHDKRDGTGWCLHYHKLTEGHTAGITIDSTPGNHNGTTVFAAGQPIRHTTGIDLRNDVVGTDQSNREYHVEDATSETAHDIDGLQHEALVTFDTTSQADLENQTDAYLASNKDDVVTWTTTIGPMDADAIRLFNVGDLITVTDVIMGLSAGVQRIAHLTWQVWGSTGAKDGGSPAPGLWAATLELGAPIRRVAFRASGGEVAPLAPLNPIAAQGTFTVDETDLTDASWSYPGGTPAGQIHTGRQYRLRVDVISNRFPSSDWGPTTTDGGSAMVVASSQVSHDPDNGGDNIFTPVADMVDPVGPGEDSDASDLEWPIAPGPYDWHYQAGSHWESSWYTYEGTYEGAIDLVFASGNPTSGFYGHAASVMITLYQRFASGGGVATDQPGAGTQVNGEVIPGGGDGSTTVFNTTLGFGNRSLRVAVNGLDWTNHLTEVSPTIGNFSLDTAPPLDATILTYYIVGLPGTTTETDTGGGSTGGGSTPIPPDPVDETPVTTLPAVSTGSVAAANALQDLIDAASAGDIIEVPLHVYREDITIDKALTLRGNGSTIDGQSSRSTWVTIAASDVTIEDFWMIDAAADSASATKVPTNGSITCDGYDRLTLKNVHTRAGRDSNLRLNASRGSQIIGCGFSTGPREGAWFWNVPDFLMVDTTFTNNLTNATYDPTYEGGGYKLGGPSSTNIHIVRCDASGNGGPAHWIDEHPSNVTYQDCTADHNDYAGFMFEISHGVLYQRCYSWENGWGDSRGDDPGAGDWGWGAGFLRSSSGVAVLTDCISAWDSAGITTINQGSRSNRESTVGLTGSGNVIAADDDRLIAAWHQDGSANQVLFTDASNHENGLRYYSHGGTVRFAWGGSTMVASAFDDTRGGVGLTLLSAPAIAAILTAAGIPGSPEAH